MILGSCLLKWEQLSITRMTICGLQIPYVIMEQNLNCIITKTRRVFIAIQNVGRWILSELSWDTKVMNKKNFKKQLTGYV